MKIKWKVGEKPTGRFASFQGRAWPYGYAGDTDTMVSHLYHPLSYTPERANGGEVALQEPFEGIAAFVRNASAPAFKWRKLKARFDTVAEAKAAVQKFYEDNPDWWPKAV